MQEELIRQAAQGGVLHNDDTSMRILQAGARTPTRAHGNVHQQHRLDLAGNDKIALYFTGWKHAGENMADVLKQRAAEVGADSDVRRSLAEHAKAAGCGNPAGQLSGSWKTTG